ncbi:PDR/VanB family oxidoreductase [Actinomadura formosensis]|uniref:PDR/VanB family oxidoreductase n=1 Tax=Actinomadura formosensis TaxID=60706 RepID=UPI000832859F|nr:PDR/VanB family oxidoreductase [Actinomadura formosensis]
MADGTGDSRLKLILDRTEQVAESVLLLEFEAVGGGPLPPWEPGAHLELRLPSGLSRQYSLCGDPADTSSYTFCVLREEQGRGGSVEVHRDLKAGDEIEARLPRNHFPLVDADEYLFVAGGIGITPIKAMVEEVERRGASWRLVYGGRARASMAFVSELAALGGERTTVVPQDEAGLLDVPGIVRALPEGALLYCCGPAGLLDAMTDACTAAGVADRLHLERFTASGAAPAAGGEDTAFEVELAASGVTLTIAADESILEAAQSIRSDLGFSCQEGYCGSCETRVLAGRPDHRGTLMSPEEHDEEGTMLICVGRSHTPKLVLDL